MKKKKILNYLIIIVFFIILATIYGKEYYYFHENKKLLVFENEQQIEENNRFKIEDIKNIRDIQLYSTPNKELLENIVSIIDESKEYIYVEVYMFTEKRLKEAIINAFTRGVEVKIILEKNPYLAANINNNTFEEFQKKGINIVWSNIDNYALNHSKMILIDGLAIVSTGNLSYANFTQNRDLFLFIKDTEIFNNLLKLFEYDFKGEKKGINHENLVLSPINSRDKITKLLEESKNEIKIHIPYFSDDNIVEKIINIKNEKKIDISVIIPETAIEDENTIKLIKEGIKIYKIPKYKLHSKAILVDNKYLFIGSINFSEYSFDKNREIGILTKEPKIINKFNEIFELDIIN